MPARAILRNGRVFDGDRFRDDVSVVLAGGRVDSIVPAEAGPSGETVDLQGLILAPGFVDVQVNGGGGVLFNDRPDVDGIRAIAAAHRRFGTTTLLPTLISDAWPVMQAAAAAVQRALADGVPGVRGIHFEGPCLSPARRGVHAEAALRPLDAETRALFCSSGLGRVVVTLAPERASLEDIATLARAGVRVCAGHSAAGFETVQAALAAGLCGFTHLFNGMAPLAGREPGVLGAALQDPASWCGVIADGHHVHPASLRLALGCKARGRVMLVTDAMPSVGAADKRFRLYGEEIAVADGVCRNAEGALAGSDLDMAGAVRNTVALLGQPLEEALRMASLYPAEFLGLADRIGRLAPGCDADLVLLDDGLTVRGTWIAGRLS